jgi:hypothetical protein
MVSTGSTKSQHAPDRQDIRSIEDFGLVRHPDTQGYVDDSEALSRAFGGTGLGDRFANRFIVTCVLATCTGGVSDRSCSLVCFADHRAEIWCRRSCFLVKLPQRKVGRLLCC